MRRARAIGVTGLVPAIGLAALLAGCAANDTNESDDNRSHAALLAPLPAEADDAIMRGVGLLLSMQEGDRLAEGFGEWPYEGVYRVGGKIPIGYRVGGTGIAILALIGAPNLDTDPDRLAAIERGVRFMCDGISHPLMSFEEFDGGYDVRGWGYIYALHALLELDRRGLIPEPLAAQAAAATAFYLKGLHEIEIPRVGGWNYARSQGKDRPSAPSSFMTGAALQALFLAADRGHTVDPAIIDRGLTVLEKGRNAAGSVSYAGNASNRPNDGTPGAVGRIAITETTLYLGGRGSIDRVRGSVDAFIVHWKWLDDRRAKPGTHTGPYSVAPYYFMFAHRYIAQAVELLPRQERDEYRRRVDELLFSVRGEDGSWNDRVFDRSANYGTAMAMLALQERRAERPVGWKPPAVEPNQADGAQTP